MIGENKYAMNTPPHHYTHTQELEHWLGIGYRIENGELYYLNDKIVWYLRPNEPLTYCPNEIYTLNRILHTHHLNMTLYKGLNHVIPLW